MMSSSRILIVDDDPHITSALELILASGQFEEITIATNADDAFDILALENDDTDLPPAVDVILLDVMMPGIDGIEACARIRKTRRYRDIPIIMCTGLDQTSALNQAFMAGAHDYLTKPIRKIELLARVRSAMRFKRELDRRRAREAELRRGHDARPQEIRFMDPRGMPNQIAFEVAMRQATASGRGHGLLALRIADIDVLRAEAGEEAVQDLVASVIRTISRIEAPLDWKPYLFGEGLFIILAPGATTEQLAQLGRKAVSAIDAMRIVHGHSLVDDFVRLDFEIAQGRGTELLMVPAQLIRGVEGEAVDLTAPETPDAPNETRAA